MLPLVMMSPAEVALQVARRARTNRLQRDLSQAGLAAMAGVSLGALKRFERTGQIAFASLVRVAIALEATAELESWFNPPPPRSIDEALARAPRSRGRRK